MEKHFEIAPILRPVVIEIMETCERVLKYVRDQSKLVNRIQQVKEFNDNPNTFIECWKCVKERKMLYDYMYFKIIRRVKNIGKILHQVLSKENCPIDEMIILRAEKELKNILKMVQLIELTVMECSVDLDFLHDISTPTDSLYTRRHSEETMFGIPDIKDEELN